MSDWTQKNAMTFRISREAAVDWGLVEPTLEERAEREEWRRRFDARQQAARLRKGEWLASLAAVTHPVLRAVIDLHGSQDREWCDGCDGGPDDSGEWPCRTIVTVLDGLGVDTTDIHLADWRNDT